LHGWRNSIRASSGAGGGPELYFTRKAVIGGSFEDLKVGTMVQVTQATGEGPMGPQASSVEMLGAEQRG
jgi:cold shock CspA family protein